jgi:antibiotic biosynthesis monooxygenase (ABM) superfamily enzyme
MATILYTVKATISKDNEAAFNKWYNEVHALPLSAAPGVLSARRYRAILGEDIYQYMTTYEFEDERAMKDLMASDLIRDLRANFDHTYPESRRAYAAYEQIWQAPPKVKSA